ncbi:ornithine decarboxylase antizyme-domain-containing protein [Lipomyces orientalis]|uniref:Ornithine decarboxylase antizyme-domain-containing protein n=1 Tax=Lipomyces orientalis TaxID=1233043 RepID=A0ACC3TPV9_9ASCO
MKLAYPRRVKGQTRGQPPADTVFFKLVDIEENVWMGSVVDRTLLIYFDKSMADSSMELKAGLVALLDLATECLDCERAVICIDKQLMNLPMLIRNFYWVGFELVKCPPDVNGGSLSDAWVAMEMDL